METNHSSNNNNNNKDDRNSNNNNKSNNQKSSSKNKKKRQRNSSQSQIDPPNSLIRLIQNDIHVAKYFEWLSMKLEQDVNVWKQRAQKYKVDNEQLQQQLQQQQNTSNSNHNNKKKQKNGNKTNRIIKEQQQHDDNNNNNNLDIDNNNNNNNNKGCYNNMKNNNNNNQDNDDTIPIDDTMFDDIDDSDTDDDDDDNESTLIKNDNDDNNNNNNNGDDNDDNNIFQTTNNYNNNDNIIMISSFLQEAYDIFVCQLNIPLLIFVQQQSSKIETMTCTKNNNNNNDDATLNNIENETKNLNTTNDNGEHQQQQQQSIKHDHSDNKVTNDIDDGGHNNNNDNNNKNMKQQQQQQYEYKSNRQVIVDILDRIRNNTLGIIETDTITTTTTTTNHNNGHNNNHDNDTDENENQQQQQQQIITSLVVNNDKCCCHLSCNPTITTLTTQLLDNNKNYETNESIDSIDTVVPLMQQQQQQLYGKRLLIRALILFDTFATSMSLSMMYQLHSSTGSKKNQGEENDYYDESDYEIKINDQKLTKLLLSSAMHARKELVNDLIIVLSSSYNYGHKQYFNIYEQWAYYSWNNDHNNNAICINFCNIDDDNDDDDNNNFVDDGDGKKYYKLIGDVTKQQHYYRNLWEHSVLCQITSCILFFKNQIHVLVKNILQYIVTATPSLNNNNNNNDLQQHQININNIISFSTLESMLLLSDPVLFSWCCQQQIVTKTSKEQQALSSTWFLDHLSIIIDNGGSNNNNKQQQLLQDALALCIHISARIWKRIQISCSSTDERSHNIACIELQSYQRLLLSSPISKWLKPTSNISYNNCQEQIRISINNIINTNIFECKYCNNELLWEYTIQTCLLLHGDTYALQRFIKETIQNTDMEWTFSNCCILGKCILVLANVNRQLNFRYRKDYEQQKSFVGGGIDINGTNENLFEENFSEMYNLLTPLAEQMNVGNRLHLISVAMEASFIYTDGHTFIRSAHSLIKELNNSTINHDGPNEVNTYKKVFDVIRKMSKVPVVRVINLRRRKDRWTAFKLQASRERIVVVKAVASLREEENQQSDHYLDDVIDGYEFGLHAVDGQGRLLEANNRLAEYVGSLDDLNRFVNTHWRPNDLKPFDKFAPNQEHMARMSPSERACALSHCSAWKGVLRSLTLGPVTNVEQKIIPHPENIVRLFKISGFAEGQALLAGNTAMPPSPVCVILEDDAILVHRFADRLKDILKELPRDFHFCSIGYSRPKSAPISPYSDLIGVPSMLWYLTGYIISAAGAQYLLDHLPIVGPVDSWIGLQMTKNWDNKFGMLLGVGAHAKPESFPTRKELGEVVLRNFRAYCALQPICSQKVRVDTTTTVGTVVAATSTGRHWRQRDTDIEYSGDAAHFDESV